MADPEQVKLLLKDVEAWNRWRKEHYVIEIDLSNANLSNADLSDADLSDADLSDADLSDADLSGAKLKYADLSGAKLKYADLSGAKLKYADLSGANLRSANLSDANLSDANLSDAILEGVVLSDANLTGVNFTGVNFTGFNFTDINLSGANLKGVNLTDSNLTKIQALGTDFSLAILTGACIEDWHINSATKLDGVICDYIYLKENQQERRPSDPNKNFAPGEFTKLFQKAISTVDLIFRNGINWEAFAYSFQQLQVKAGTTDLSIQAIENKGDGDFVIRVNTPPGADKAEIQRFVEQEYQVKLKAIEDKYRYQLQAKEELIEECRQKSTDLLEITKILAGRETLITVENKAVAESKDNSNTFNNDFKEAKIGNVANQVTDNARLQANQYNYASPEKQTLAEAAAEIQKLLKQLQQTNPDATETQQEAFVSAAIAPTKKERLINALKEGGQGAIEEFLDNPYLNVAIRIIEGWRNP